MDMEMPIMGGVDATRMIRRMQEQRGGSVHVPILGISANVRPEQCMLMPLP
jgi:CheY-like chemotaxis protein